MLSLNDMRTSSNQTCKRSADR